MAQIGSMVIDLVAETASFNANIKKATATLNSEAAQMRRSMEQVRSGLDSIVAGGKALASLTLGFASLGGAMSAGRQFLAIADESKQMRAQLLLATAELGSFGAAQRDVARISAETRGSLDATTKLYGNMLRASTPLGKSQADAARATETFAKALKIGGAGAEEASSATLQFGQALASGVLRGDEFNSIAEASPRIMRLLADSLGVTTGELRKMAEAGELTSDRLFRALTDKKYTDGIDAEFRKLPVTFDQAMGQISNAAVVTFGAFDQGGEFSTMLASFVTDGASGFQSMASSAERFGITVRSELQGITAEARAVIEVVNNITGTFRRIDAAIGAPIKKLNEVAEYLNPVTLAKKALLQNPIYTDARDQTRRELENNATDRQMQAFLGGYDVLGNPIGAGAPRSAPAASGGNAGKKAADSAAKVKREMEAMKREAEAAARELATMYDGFLSRYFPAQKALDESAKRLADIRKLASSGAITPDMAAQATLMEDLGDVGSGSIVPEWKDQYQRIREELDVFVNRSKAQADEFKTGWKQAADETLRSLDHLSYGIQSGNFLDIMGGVIDMLLQLGSLGLFGSGIQANIKGARASGGPVSARGTYLVGEKGPELFTPATSGRIVPNHQLSSISERESRMAANDVGTRADRMMAGLSPARVEIVPSPYFQAVVRGEAASVAAPMATQGGVAGASLAETRMQRRSRNRIPG